MRTYRALWLALCGALATIGAAVAFVGTVPAMLALFSCAAAAGGAVTVKWCWDGADTELSWPDMVRLASTNALLTGTTVVAVVGLGALFGPGAWLILALAAASSPYAVRRYRDHLRRLGWSRSTPVEQVTRPQLRGTETVPVPQNAAECPSPNGTDTTAPPEDPTETLALSDADLCRAWRASFTALQRADSPSQRLRIAEARRNYLDELDRRHPHGTEAWLASGARAAGDPTKFMVANTNPGRDPIDWDRFLHGLDT